MRFWCWAAPVSSGGTWWRRWPPGVTRWRSARARRPAAPAFRQPRASYARFEELTDARAWRRALAGVEASSIASASCASAARETYERVHHVAPAALAAACARAGLRLVHVSALGLSREARSGFIRSKLRGEAAIRASGADYTIVRPSLLDGEGGFGARWLRAVARWPVHCVPAGRRRPHRGAAMSRMPGWRSRACASCRARDHREAELGGHRAAHAGWAPCRAARRRAAPVVRIPGGCSRASRATCATSCTARRSRSAISSFCAATTCRGRRSAAVAARAPPRRGALRLSAQQRLREIAPAFRRRSPRWWKYTERASAVKARVDSSASKGHRARRDRRARASRALATKRGALRASAAAGASPPSSMVIGDRVGGGPSRLERGMNAARRQRRHETGRVADQQHVAGGHRRHRSAHGNEPAATTQALRAAQIRRPARPCAGTRADRAARMPACEADLRDAVVARNDPAHVAARKLPSKKQCRRSGSTPATPADSASTPSRNSRLRPEAEVGGHAERGPSAPTGSVAQAVPASSMPPSTRRAPR